MSVVQFTTESYNSQNTVRANAGDWVEAEVTFQTLFQVGSGTADALSYVANGTSASLSFQQTDFDEQGFMVGDIITISYYNQTTGVSESFPREIIYVSGNQIQLNSGLPSNIVSGAVFPTDGELSGMSIVADKRPNAIEFFFNLAPNGSNSLGSVVEGSLTRLQLEDTDTIAISTPTAMSQLGEASGSYIKDVELEYVADSGDGWKDWKVTFKFIQWGFLKDGYTTDNPPYYAGIDHIAPLNRIKAFAELGNPNGIITGNTQNTQANTGGFDENYNGGTNLYTVMSTSWVDSLGNPIDSLDYSGECTFTSVINAPGQSNPQSNYLLGLIWRPTDGTYYEQRVPSLANNLLLLAPENLFQADGVQDVTVYPGFPYIGDISGLNTDGAQWDLKDVTFTISGVDEVTIEGTIVPNAACSGLFVDVPDGGRKSTLWVSIGDYTTDAANNSKRVSLKLWDEDNYDAPTLGVQIPDVVDENLYDHDSNDIDTPLPQTTTEDDVLYISNFKLVDGLQYEGIRTRIFAYNTTTEEEFTLEDGFFSFTNVPFVNGIFEVNESQPRNFNLPPTTDRNHISLVRNNALDGGGKYGVTLEYGFLNDWRYWLEEADANDDFFDYTVPERQNGLNKNWQHYSNSGDWIIRVAYYTRLAGVDDFNYYEMGIRPYEDDVNVTAVTNLTVLSTGATPNALVADELIEIETIFTWSGFLFTNEWVEYTVENFENGNRWVMSSVLDQGNVSQNPLKPIVGQTVIDVTGTGTNQLTCKALIDTSLIDVNKVSLSFRVYSEDNEDYEYLIDDVKDALIAFDLRKLSEDAVYPDSSPCIRVRRTLDNAEQDIGFLNNVLDTGDMLDFVTNSGADPTGGGFVTTWYDQSSLGNDATQTTASKQPQIVRLGSVLLDGGKPTMEFDGTDDCFDIVSKPLQGKAILSMFAVSNYKSANSYEMLFTHSDGLGFPGRMEIRRNAAANLVEWDIDQFKVGTTAVDNLQQLYSFTNPVSGTTKTYVNDLSDTTFASTGGAMGNYNCQIGARNNAFYFDGNVQAVVFFDSNVDATITQKQDNFNNYYSLY